MSHSIVIGTETEFGITALHDPDFKPVLASTHVVNAEVAGRRPIRWSFEEESPGLDLRGYGTEESFPFDSESGLVSTVLTNGARFYVDHAHPEYSSPETTNPYDAALYDKVGESIVHRATMRAAELFGVGDYRIHKNNSDGHSNSYGWHENYLVERDIPFETIVDHLTGFLVSRVIIAGSGKVGAENDRDRVDYQISQRADFIEERVGLETTLKRPIINTRDEPHADPLKYRRLHIILGDATLSEVQTFLKLGTVALFLAALSDNALGDPLVLDDPVSALRTFSHDPTLDAKVALADGRHMTAVEMQRHYYARLATFRRRADLHESFGDLLGQWDSVLRDLAKDPLLTADRLDWTAKLALLKSYRERESLAWSHPKLALVALQYHDVHPGRSLFRKLTRTRRMQRLFTDEQIAAACVAPPQDTRAFFRGECIRLFGDSIVAANWDSLVFETGADNLWRVPMMEPLRGTRDHVGDVLERSGTPAELIETLGDIGDGS
ncbi:MAG TPA: proteasome accessory factor PafA2 [Actinobacteria bacterium]|nr:proteasome accessory factor PafA2 [Actinomycetota bacterium]